MCKIITLTGMSACGKDTILKEVIKLAKIQKLENIKPIISFTTRPPRQGEKQGKEYNFISHKEFIEKLNKNDFIEYREYKTQFGDWLYGIDKTTIDINSNNIYIVIVDFVGMTKMKQYCVENNIKLHTYYIEVSEWTRLNRSLQREPNCSDEKIEEIIRRYLDDKKTILPAKQKADTILCNEHPRGSYNNALKIINNIKNT